MHRSTRLYLATILVSCAAAIATMLTAPPARAAEAITAQVVHVDDGDTVVARRGGDERLRVRLANIDAPETNHGRCRPGQPFSDVARKRLEGLVGGRTVRLLCYDQDRYGRAICDIDLGGTTASRTLVAEGLAWANRASAGYVRDRAVLQLEEQARASRTGLWSDKGSTAPWVWRRTEWMDGAAGCRQG